MREPLADVPAAPFGAERLLLFVTGSLSATFVPWWINWLRSSYPALELRVVLTRSAERFVSRHALTALTERSVALDSWRADEDEPIPGSVHVEYATWPDAIAVYPATFHFLSRYATGLADTPMLLALQCTSAVVGVAPSVPPGAVDSPSYRQHVAALARRSNTTIIDPHEGRSAHTGDIAVGTAGPLPLLLARMELLRRSGANGRRALAPRTKETVAWRE
jgi:phosphopantothenoylcysteine synthetase/decarboxylase